MKPAQGGIRHAMVVDSDDDIYIAVKRDTKKAPDSPSKSHLLKYYRQGDHVWSRQLGAGRDEDPQDIVVQASAADDQGNLVQERP